MSSESVIRVSVNDIRAFESGVRVGGSADRLVGSGAEGLDMVSGRLTSLSDVLPSLPGPLIPP